MEEDGGVKGGVEGSSWGYFVVCDAVCHGLLVGVGEIAEG